MWPKAVHILREWGNYLVNKQLTLISSVLFFSTIEITFIFLKVCSSRSCCQELFIDFNKSSNKKGKKYLLYETTYNLFGTHLSTTKFRWEKIGLVIFFDLPCFIKDHTHITNHVCKKVFWEDNLFFHDEKSMCFAHYVL